MASDRDIFTLPLSDTLFLGLFQYLIHLQFAILSDMLERRGKYYVGDSERG
jgi:hypothetical protein